MERGSSSCSQVSDIQVSSIRIRFSDENKDTLYQSPLEDELQGLASTDTEAVSTPEPRLESEIEIAAEADTAKNHDKNDDNVKKDDNDGDNDQAAGTELLNSAAARLKLSTRPGEDMSPERLSKKLL